jgi:glutathione S-transferase
MSQIILYDNPESTNANKVRFVLAELALDHQVREMPLRDKPKEYFDIHPFGLVPTLIDGDLVITESNVALRYLAEREGRADLRGTTPAHRAQVDGLLDTLSLELRPALWAVEEDVVYGLELTSDERASRHTALVAAAAAYDRRLAAAPGRHPHRAVAADRVGDARLRATLGTCATTSAERWRSMPTRQCSNGPSTSPRRAAAPATRGGSRPSSVVSTV